MTLSIGSRRRSHTIVCSETLGEPICPTCTLTHVPIPLQTVAVAFDGNRVFTEDGSQLGDGGWLGLVEYLEKVPLSRMINRVNNSHVDRIWTFVNGDINRRPGSQ